MASGLIFAPAPSNPTATAGSAAARAAPAITKTISATTASADPVQNVPASLAAAKLSAGGAVQAQAGFDAALAGGGGGGGDGAGSGSAGSQAGSSLPNALAGPAQTAVQTLTANLAAPTGASPTPASYGAALTAQIAAQMTAKAGSGLGAFAFALEPQGLGRVDVSLKIDAQGQLSAVLSFDNAGVAAEAKARSGDLQQALQQAGFNLSQSGLTFTSGGGQGGGSAWQGAPSRSFTSPTSAPVASVDASPTSTPTAWRATSGARGLDIVI